MDNIKFRLEDSQSYAIETDLFEAETQKAYPFYQKQTSGYFSQFAICPECNNPVQIIGLYKKSAHTDKQFAKHCAEPIPHIGIYDKSNYEYCPYRAKRKHFTKDSRSPPCESWSIASAMWGGGQRKLEARNWHN
ncbi:hypothetical protein [Chelonobacter oris]|uniref:hypothetical protein n=1 Tax=Chelonobacter oris TaxID=505317 RepID=UPI0024482CF2|nr:hypothetical protein [Chelonobacter oris]